MSYSRQLADFVCATHFDDIPAPVTARARQLLIDTLGVGLAGSRHPNAIQALAGIKAIPGAIGERPVIGSEVSLTAPYAALVNGVACHALDFDDTCPLARRAAGRLTLRSRPSGVSLAFL